MYLKISAITVFLLVLIISINPTTANEPNEIAAFHLESSANYPNSSLGEFFLNKCFMEYPPGIISTMGEVITHRYINPRSMAAAIICLILVLPFVVFSSGRPRDSDHIRDYLHAKFGLLHFLHRVNYAVLLICGLYSSFRQGRPCEMNGNLIGGYYGMPSGDAMGGTILAMFVVGKSWFRIVIAIAIALLVDLARVASGFHSIGMVLTGSAIALCLHLYSQRAPIWHIWIDTFISTVGVSISLGIDKSLVFGFNNQNNLWGWVFFGTGIQVFVCAMIWRILSKYKIPWTFSYKKIMTILSDNTENSFEMPKTENVQHDTDYLTIALIDSNTTTNFSPDYFFTYFMFFVCLVFQFFAVIVQVYDWIGIPGEAKNAGGPTPL